MAFFYPTAQFSLEGKALVVPVVSTANVSQLAMDLLITSLGLSRVGIFDPSYLVPVVGAREDPQEAGVSTPLELFGREDLSVAVIQHRSPALKSRKIEFIDALLKFIRDSSFSSVLFVSGVDLSNRTDDQMMTPTYHIHPKNTPEWTSTPLSSIPHLPIPPYTSPVMLKEGTPEASVPFIPGGGLTRRILASLASSDEPWSVPTAALLQFVLEGDNRADANLLAAVVAKVLGVDGTIPVWKQPESWKQGLFGTPQDQSLYG